ncbi:hypothetical protein LINPERPRIM_LOCUS10240 [Linum perenne]
MANPRRSSYSVNINDDGAGAGVQQSSSSFSTSSSFSSSPLLITLKHWLKKPHAFPFLLSAFLLLTWISLLLQQRSSHSNSSSSSSSALAARIGDRRKFDDDRDVNLVRFGSGSGIAKDDRGWLLDPVSLALKHGLKGGAGSCASLHVGEIRPGTLRGNHRHNGCNETLVIWGAKTLFRLENHQIVDKGYAEVVVEGDQVAVATSPSGTAHAIVNVDSLHSTFIIGCQDCVTDRGTSISNSSDYNVWPNL